MIIFGSEALSLIGEVNNSPHQLEAMPALTFYSSSSEVRGGVSMSESSDVTPLATVEPFVVRLGVGPRWWS